MRNPEIHLRGYRQHQALGDVLSNSQADTTTTDNYLIPQNQENQTDQDFLLPAQIRSPFSLHIVLDTTDIFEKESFLLHFALNTAIAQFCDI